MQSITDSYFVPILNHSEFEKLVKDGEVNLEVENEHSLTLFLYVASIEKLSPQLEILLKYSYDTVFSQKKGGMHNALALAIFANNYKGAQLLLRYGFHPDMGSRKGTGISAPPLFLACKMKSVKMVKLLLDYNADVNQIHHHYTCLIHAAENSELLIAKTLLEYGANPYHMHALYGSALNCAVWEDNFEMVQLLIEYGARADVTNTENQSILLAPAKNGNKVLILYLLQHGATINEHCTNGITPLMYICRYGTAYPKEICSIIQFMKSLGVNIHQKDKQGHTALWEAVESQNILAVDCLRRLGGSLKEATYNHPRLFSSANSEFLDYLLTNGADINIRSKDEEGNWVYDILYYNQEPAAGIFEVIKSHMDKMEPALKEEFLTQRLSMLLASSE